ncbi:MAG: MOSC domain-containing protein [Pseudomonadota bacterium]
MSGTITSIYRYPVKGLNGQRLASVAVTAGQTLPHDRRFAIAHGSTRFDTAAPTWMAKTNFLMLAKDEKLAQLDADFDEESGEITIRRDGKQVVKADATNIMGRTLIGQFFAGFMAASARGTPKLLEAPGHSFSDVPEKVLSIISLTSVKDLERVARQPVDPIRFRGNIYVDGLPAWQEFDWVGQEISIGSVRLRVQKRIERCAATNVNPQTAERDSNIPLTLRRGYNHADMGIYAEVLGDGQINEGDPLKPPA